MPYHDTTWTIVAKDDNDSVIVEQDVRVYYEISGIHQQGLEVLNIKDVKALFRKHDKWVERELPDDLLQLAKLHFDTSADFAEEIWNAHEEDAKQDYADARGDEVRLRRLDNKES
jgi:hypothetical protein